MSPLKAVVLTMSRDLAQTLQYARHLQEQGRAIETFARALLADMEVKRVVRGMQM